MLSLIKSRLTGKTLFFIFILLSSFLYATIINVPGDQPTIQEGINVSVDGDTVLVQPDTYFENINYNGKNITVASLFLTTQDTTYISQTVIDGNENGHVVTFINGEDSTAVLCGFTITNGLASGIFPESCGGGIFCYDYSSPSLENVTISGNSADIHGGGIYCDSSSPSLKNVAITGNSATLNGGGICCQNNSSPSLENVTITGNIAFSFDPCSGGGICCRINSSPSLVNVTISDNITGEYGGGIYCASGSSPSLVNVTVTGNSTVDGSGGGIYCELYSSPILVNVTITGNSATYNGGGIYCYINSNPVLINTILWNDSPQEVYFLNYGDPNSITISYSDIQGGEAGIITNNNGTVYWLEGNIDEDPLFVDAGSGDYHLQQYSPCIDAGDPASPLDPDGTIADMGAYYFHQTIAPDPPQNVTVEIIGTNIHLSWDAVTGANSYKVYSSDDPYTGFVEDTSGSFVGESWSTSIMEMKKFYYVIASTEINSDKLNKKSIK